MKRKNDNFWRGVAISELILFLIAVAVMLPILYLKKDIQCEVFETTTAAVASTTTPEATTAMMESNLTTTEDFKTTAIMMTTEKLENTTPLHVFTETTYLEQPSEMNVLVLHSSLSSAYLINKDGSSKKPARINGPYDNFAYDSAFAMIKGRLYIFGGLWIDDPDEPDNQKKIGYLEECEFKKIPQELNFSVLDGSIALSLLDGESAMICFGINDPQYKQCDTFDGTTVESLPNSSQRHHWGCLAHYNGQPTAVGGWVDPSGFLNPTYPTSSSVESFNGNYWTSQIDLQFFTYGHNCVNVEDALFTLGGHFLELRYDDIWRLKNNNWDVAGKLKTGACDGSSILIDSSVYIFGGWNLDKYSVPIQRVDFEGESIIGTEVIGAHNGKYPSPVLYHAPFDFCV